MPIGSAIGAVGSIIAGDRVSSASAKSAAETNFYNRENYKNRYQWQVKDMRKAGLNPALSYTTGAGTPTGGVQQTDFGGSQYNEASQQAGSLMSKLSTQLLQREQINNAKNMNEQIKAQTEQTKSQTNIQNAKLAEELLNLQSSTAKNYSDINYGSILKTTGSIADQIYENLIDSTSAKGGFQPDGSYKAYKPKSDNVDKNSPWIKNRMEMKKYERQLRYK